MRNIKLKETGVRNNTLAQPANKSVPGCNAQFIIRYVAMVQEMMLIFTVF